jgi:hypothetical protein
LGGGLASSRGVKYRALVGGQALRDGIGEGGGWSSNLQQFAKAASNEA